MDFKITIESIEPPVWLAPSDEDLEKGSSKSCNDLKIIENWVRENSRKVINKAGEAIELHPPTNPCLRYERTVKKGSISKVGELIALIDGELDCEG